MMKNNNKVEINHDPNWPYISDHTYRTLFIGDSGSGKTNVLLNVIKNQRPYIDKIYLYVKNPFKSKLQLLVNRKEKGGTKKLKYPKVFINYSQIIDDVYENLENYSPTKNRKVLIVFDDMVTDMEANKNLNPFVSELFSRGRLLNISLF